jgi:hypothetical protein
MPNRPRKPASKPCESQEKIGYGHPPRAHRFKPGQSGNPSGRPARRKGLADLLAGALQQSTSVRERGRLRKMTKAEAMARRFADLAVEGDPRILRLLLGEIRAAEERAQEEPALRDVLTAADREVIAALVVRIGGRQ